MNSELIQQLTGRDTLLALGISLLVLGFVLRSFAQGLRRELAARKQHALQLRRSGNPSEAESVARETKHWEKYLPRYAAGFIITGLLMLVVAAFR